MPTDSLHALIAQWRKNEQRADEWARACETTSDYANAHAFRKECRIWKTCADDLSALLLEGVERPQGGEEKDTRVDSFPEGEHGDLPRPATE